MVAAVVEIWQYVRTRYGVDIFPNERPYITLDKNIIIITIVVIVVCVPTSKCRDGRGGGGGARFFFFYTTVSVRGETMFR